MKTRTALITSSLLSTMICAAGLPNAYAGNSRASSSTITLMQLSDVHGHIAPHAVIFPDGTKDPNAGGLAKLTTLIKQVRASNPNNLLLAVGDTTHGSAEMMFTLGDAIMPALNTLGIDAFTPGNWDFGWGPRVYRQRFTPNTSIELAPNNRTTVAWMDGKPGHEGQTCNQPGGLKPYAQCHVTKANFPTIVSNVYNYNEVAKSMGPLVHPAWMIKQVGNVKVGIIGITSDVVPQQAQAFNTGFRFTMGYKELPGNIAAAKAAGANIIVVQSELGLAKNVQLVKEFSDIRVMFSAHTHERTPQAIEIRDEHGNLSLVTEAGEDGFLGRLDLNVSRGKISSYTWNMLEANSSVIEDPAMKAIVDQERSTFVSGPDAQCHTFGVNAFPFGKGHTLCDPLDTVVGRTEPTIERFNVLEEISNNAMVDAFVDFARGVDLNLTPDNSLSITNGFRFDVTILGSDDGYGDITIGDLYDYYPIGAALALAEFSGGRLLDHWENILSNVFDPNPYEQRGGWFLGFTNNMHFDIQLNDDFPRTISEGKRIENATINGAPFDRSKVYTMASCYPHGNPIDEVCRTSGASNLRFMNGTRETNCASPDTFGNCQLDVNGYVAIVNPLATSNIYDPARTPIFLRVTPDNFVHPVDALRKYLPGHTITTAEFGPGRVTAVTGVPISAEGGAGIVQPTQGAGPGWLKRVILEEGDHD